MWEKRMKKYADIQCFSFLGFWSRFPLCLSIINMIEKSENEVKFSVNGNDKEAFYNLQSG